MLWGTAGAQQCVCPAPGCKVWAGPQRAGQRRDAANPSHYPRVHPAVCCECWCPPVPSPIPVLLTHSDVAACSMRFCHRVGDGIVLVSYALWGRGLVLTLEDLVSGGPFLLCLNNNAGLGPLYLGGPRNPFGCCSSVVSCLVWRSASCPV